MPSWNEALQRLRDAPPGQKLTLVLGTLAAAAVLILIYAA